MAHQSSFGGVRIAGKPADMLWDISCKAGRIHSIEEHKILPGVDCDKRLLAPSLCHPHIHLDKCFLLSHPKYSDLIIQNGDFAEAMKLTSMCVNILLNFSNGGPIPMTMITYCI